MSLPQPLDPAKFADNASLIPPGQQLTIDYQSQFLPQPDEIVSHAELHKVHKAPKVRIASDWENTGGTYTLIFVDPDAIGGTTFIHWVVTGATISGQTLSPGVTVREYFPPKPPSGVHRYQFFLFSEPATFKLDKSTLTSFNLTRFTIKNKLTLVGGFQFKASSD